MKNFAVRSFISRALPSLVFGLAILSATPAFSDEKVVVGVFTTESQADFDKKIKPVFDDFKNSCKSCEVLNLTPYDDKGNYSEKGLVDKLKNPPAEVSFFYFDWNKKNAADQNAALIAALSEKADQGKVVVSPTGQAKEGEQGAPLTRTIMGQARDVVIIGEITDRDRMLPQSYFGPEILTALRPPKSYIGQGHSALYFAARLAANWNKRKPTEWIPHFKEKKQKTRKLWLDADDLVGR